MYNIIMEKIGILGGAFDPPHLEHLLIAKNAIMEFGYSRVIFMPSYNPPHKKLISNVKDRLSMLELVTAKDNICEIEIGKTSVTYTVNTIPELKRLYGENIELIIGGDSMRDFHTWHKPYEILKQIKLVVACRDYQLSEVKNAILRYRDAEKVGIELMRYQPRSMSSSSIRSDLRLGYDVTGKLNSKVYEYIKANKLYAEYESIISKLQRNLDERTFLHTLSTCRYALKYVNALKLDYGQVFTAALLHDCAKTIKDFENFDIPKDSKFTQVAHAFAGRSVAAAEYGVTDKSVLDAIYYHTTAKVGMSDLEKLIYCADKLNETRNYDGVETLRQAFENDFNDGFRMCLESGVSHLMERHAEIYPLTLKALEYYKK